MDVILYVVLGLVVLYFFLRRDTRKYKQIPGPKEWPLVGYAPYMKDGKTYTIFSKLANVYGEIFKITIFGKALIVLNNAKLIRTAFSGDTYKKYMNDRSDTFFGKYVYRSQSIGLMPKAYGSDHGPLRKTFAKGMHVYGEGKKDFEDRVMCEIINLVKRIDNHQGREFDMLAALRRSLTNLMSVLLGGHDLKDTDKDLNMFWDYDKWTDYLFSPDITLVMTKFPFLRFVPGKYKNAFEEVQRAKETIVRRYLDEKKAVYKPGQVNGLMDFLIAEQLEELEQKGQLTFLTDDKIKAVLLETVAGGILTTLGSLSSLFLCLMNHPEYQEKIQEELDRIVGRERLPRIEDRQECMFTEAVIVEAQRYITTVPLSVPHFCEKGIEFEGFEVPPKSLIISNVWYVHHDEKIWGDPWTFRPERWLDEHGCPLPNDHQLRKNWLAFSVGRRQCPGESLARSRLFLYVATLLQRWNFEMPPEHAVPCDPRRGPFDIGLNCRTKPYMCRVVPRQTKHVEN